MKRLLISLLFVLGVSFLAEAQPAAPILPLSQVRPGMRGEVWTVFQGTKPEPFSVEIVGVIQNALGPGKSLILARMTDPRVQKMGAGAGMSGSPLYLQGRLAGALSYQLQRFETIPHAGFTPIEDLMEVSRLPGVPTEVAPAPIPLRGSASGSREHRDGNATAAASSGYNFEPLRPVFTLSGLSPEVADCLAPEFRALGLTTATVGGAYGSSARSEFGAGGSNPVRFPETLRPGDAVSVALATGDITIAGTGTVCRVDGNHLLAFGHPLMRLGAVDLPMAASEVITILPSLMSSFKVVNVGPVIGTISQDRLSAVYGQIGHRPEMIPIEVGIAGRDGKRTLRFSVVRHPQIAPVIAAAGLTQGILGTNDSGLAEGFRVHQRVTFPGGQVAEADHCFAGPQGFTAGLSGFVRDLAGWLQNPYERVYPTHVDFTVEPLEHNPLASLEVVQLSRSSARPGDTVQVTVTWRDYQEQRSTRTVTVPVDPKWAGKSLEVVVTSGPALDELTGRPATVGYSQIRSFDEYLAALEDYRRTDGIYVAVVEKSDVFLDQTQPTPDFPDTLARIARTEDEQRYQRHEAMAALWEQHLLDGRVVNASVRRPLQVTD